MPKLPPHPVEWDIFMNSPQLGSLLRKLNSTFSLTAMGVDNGSFLHWSTGKAAVTLAGGRTYHRILPSHEGEHAIRWFLYDMQALRENANQQKLPESWIAAALAGLRRVNPFVERLEQLAVAGAEGGDLALHLDIPDTMSSAPLAAVVSIAPACKPTPRKYLIRYKGETEHRFLPNTSPLIEPLHYPMLLPHGTLGWSIGRTGPSGQVFTQMRWYRTRFFMHEEQFARLCRLSGEPSVNSVMQILTNLMMKASSWWMRKARLRSLA
jgi:hypothetical protein